MSTLNSKLVGQVVSVMCASHADYLPTINYADEKRIPPQAWTWMPTGKRKRGRPRSTLRRTVQRDMQTGNISGIDLFENARDRTGWRALLSALCT